MSDSAENEPTRLLHAMSAGDRDAARELLPLVYRELHATAERLMRGERDEHTLQPTALIHEAFLKLVGPRDGGWEGKGHFLRVASRAMRQVLVDHARARKTQKRGGDGERQRVTLHETAFVVQAAPDDILGVDRALAELAKQDERLHEIVELRFFGGLTNSEIAAALDTSLRTVERGWRLAKAWLVTAIDQARDDEG